MDLPETGVMFYRGFCSYRSEDVCRSNNLSHACRKLAPNGGVWLRMCKHYFKIDPAVRARSITLARCARSPRRTPPPPDVPAVYGVMMAGCMIDAFRAELQHRSQHVHSDQRLA